MKTFEQWFKNYGNQDFSWFKEGATFKDTVPAERWEDMEAWLKTGWDAAISCVNEDAAAKKETEAEITQELKRLLIDNKKLSTELNKALSTLKKIDRDYLDETGLNGDCPACNYGKVQSEVHHKDCPYKIAHEALLKLREL